MSELYKKTHAMANRFFRIDRSAPEWFLCHFVRFAIRERNLSDLGPSVEVVVPCLKLTSANFSAGMSYAASFNRHATQDFSLPVCMGLDAQYTEQIMVFFRLPQEGLTALKLEHNLMELGAHLANMREFSNLQSVEARYAS